MKKIALIITFIFYFLLHSQTNFQDVVHLKNGSTIYGLIIEQIPNENIKIKSGQNIYVFDFNEIEKITKEEVSSSEINTNNNSIPYNEKEMEAFLIRKLESESKGNLGFVDFKKIDGVSKVKDGQNWYTIYFSFTFKPNINVWKSGNNSVLGSISGYWKNFEVSTEKTNEWNMQLVGEQKLYKANQPVRLTGKSDLFRTEMNWNISSLTFSKEHLLTPAEINVLEKEKIEEINKELNNTSSNFEYESIETETFYVNDIPILNNTRIDLTKIESVNTNFNVTELQNLIIKVFENNRRFQKINNKSDNSYSYEFLIESLRYQYDQGISPISKKQYSGFTCDIKLQLTVIDNSSGSKIVDETLSVVGGNPKLNTDKQKAYNLCVTELSKTLNQLLYSYFPVLSSFEGVESYNRKGIPRFIYLDNAEYFEPKMKLSFILIDENDLYVNENTLNFSNHIASCEFKKFENGKLVCKVLDGGEKILTYIENNRKLAAVSIVLKPSNVN